jgi:hypothetical protein
MTTKLKTGITILVVIFVILGIWLALGWKITRKTGYTVAVVTGTTF